MSSPATSNFLNAWRRSNASRATLVKVELTTPSALTLHYASRELMTPDGQLWQAGVQCDSIRESIDLLGQGLRPVDTTIRFAKRRDASQTSGTIHDILHQYVIQNAVVTIYLWEMSLPSISDALMVFKGKVSRPVDLSPSGVTLHLIQDISWNMRFPDKVVDATTYPNAPPRSLNSMIPVVYGDFSSNVMRLPWGSSARGLNSSEQGDRDMSKAKGAVPFVTVDTGIGAQKVKLVGSSAAMTQVVYGASTGSRWANSALWYNNGESLDLVAGSGLTWINTASESGVTIDDDKLTCQTCVLPIDVRTGVGHTTALNPRNALDPLSETTYTTLDQSSGYNVLQLILPNATQRGMLLDGNCVSVVVAYSGDAANTQSLKISGYTPGVGYGAGATGSMTSTSSTIKTASFLWPTSYFNKSWDFGSTPTGVGTTTAYDVRIEFNGAVAANKAKIYWVQLLVQYKPDRSMVSPGRTIYPPETGEIGFVERRSAGAPSVPRQSPRVVPTIVDPMYSLDASFYANVFGIKDDPGGTFTGTAGSVLIQRPCDIIKHLLYTYAYGSPGSFSFIETGSGVAGSFTDARAVLRNASPYDFNIAAWLGSQSTVQQAIEEICRQSLCCAYLDRFTDKWNFYVWKLGSEIEYDITLGWHDLASITVEQTSVVDVKTALRLSWFEDLFSSKHLFSSYINPSTSNQSDYQNNVVDQRLTFSTGVNAKIDWQYGATVYAATIAAGTYTANDACAEIRSKMRTAQGNNHIDFGYGFNVSTGYNDKIDFVVGVTTYQATLDPFAYTAESLALEIASAMNAVPGHGLTFACSYDHFTNKFTLSAGSNFKLDGSSAAAGYATSATHLFGVYTLTAAATSITGSHERYADRFWIGAYSNFNMLWETGTNTAQSCRDVLGYAKADSGTTQNNPATYMRGTRSDDAYTLQTYFGPRAEETVEVGFIRDQETAVQYRNRWWDLTANPRIVAKFSTFQMPDAKRMLVFAFNETLDDQVVYPRFGTDGSWKNKPMRVLEVEQGLGPNYATEILAVSAD